MFARVFFAGAATLALLCATANPGLVHAQKAPGKVPGAKRPGHGFTLTPPPSKPPGAKPPGAKPPGTKPPGGGVIPHPPRTILHPHPPIGGVLKHPHPPWHHKPDPTHHWPWAKSGWGHHHGHDHGHHHGHHHGTDGHHTWAKHAPGWTPGWAHLPG